MALPRVLFVLIALSVAEGALLSMPLQAWCQSEKGWLLTQTHPANGKQKVFVFPSHLRIENPNLGYTVVADADSGNVWTFNDARKMVCCLKWDRFEHNFSNLLDLGGENMARMKWSPAKEKKGPVILGLETETYEAKGDRFTFKGSGGRGGFISGGGKTENIDFTVYTARKIVTNSKLLKVLCQMETIPIMGGVPLRQTSYYPNRNPKILRVRFDTSAARKISDDKKLWAIPKYKTVVTVTEVASQTDKAFIKDLLGE